MLVFERPGVFLGKAHNNESWYVVDTTYAKFEKQVISEWRARYKPTNRPKWVRPIASFGIPLLVLAGMTAAVFLIPSDGWTQTFLLLLALGVVLLIFLLRLSAHFWPGMPAVDGHIHAVVPVHPDIAATASDSTGWLELWEVSQAYYRASQAAELGLVLQRYLEVLHAPEERKVVTEARELILSLSEQRLEDFHTVADWSTLFYKRGDEPVTDDD